MIARRPFLLGAAAMLAPLPSYAGEIWYYRGIPVLVARLPDKVEMKFEVGAWGECGVGRLLVGRTTDNVLRRAVRQTIDFQLCREPVRWTSAALRAAWM